MVRFVSYCIYMYYSILVIWIGNYKTPLLLLHISSLLPTS